MDKVHALEVGTRVPTSRTHIQARVIFCSPRAEETEQGTSEQSGWLDCRNWQKLASLSARCPASVNKVQRDQGRSHSTNDCTCIS